MLTVLVPIKDEDATVVTSLPAIDTKNINVIYKHEGIYKRLWINPSTNQYEYHEVVDREFPYLGKPLEIFDFTYDATRMGSDPTISAQNVMWFAEKDENGNDVTLENLWLERNRDCHVSFNGENFYLKQVPTCSKDNEDARYKYDIDFVSERAVLENVYVYDVVTPYITERPISESSIFSFFGSVKDLVDRINISLVRSGLSQLVQKQHEMTEQRFDAVARSFNGGPVPEPAPTAEERITVKRYVPLDESGSAITEYLDDAYDLYLSPYMPYADWNDIGVSGGTPVTMTLFTSFGGDYAAFLRSEVYEFQDGDYVFSGYQCKIGKDKKGDAVSSEEKLVSLDNNTVHEALQLVHDIFGLQYYVYSEKNQSGVPTGNTIIMIADCEHDFADVDGDDYVRDSDGIPTTEHPFDYGVDNQLLSKEKTNTTDKIVTRITGVGSTENIPWYYPNPTADGWIKPVYKTNGEVSAVEVDYPTSEGDTVSENVRYEKYLKNRIGDVFRFGKIVSTKGKSDYNSVLSNYYTDEQTTIPYVYLQYYVSAKNVQTPYFTMMFNVSEDSNMTRVRVWMEDLTDTTNSWQYDTDVQYSEPDTFQQICISGDGSVLMPLSSEHVYSIRIRIDVSTLNVLSRTFDYSGYHYSYTTIDNPNSVGTKCHVPEDFYGEEGLVPFALWKTDIGSSEYTPVFGGYSEDGSVNTVKAPMLRVPNKKYKDIGTGTIYMCYNGGERHYDSTINCLAFLQNPTMLFEEWIETFVSMKLVVYDSEFWYKDNKKIDLYDFGMELDSSVTPNVYDTIEFQRVKYVTPQPNLMPEVYIKTDGERRFYNAVNYPLSGGSPDAMIGEEESGGLIINPIYYKEDTEEHYDFENEYIQSRPHEHIENFDDVKPTIKGQTNIVNGHAIRIDVVEEFAYDELDSDEIWESNDGGNVSGEYKHPYFFAKLRPLGFNLFDLALQEDMVLSMTTGHCGACNFKIGVDENTKKNPVQIWEYDVYEGSDWNTKVFKYHEGTLRRYVDTSNLYYDTDGTESGYVLVDTPTQNVVGFLVSGDDTFSSRTNTFRRQNYSASEVVSGEVGALRKDGKNHFEGDVKTNGKFIESQQDTSENYVWVALMKDTDSYGVLMPSAKPDYGDGNFSVYIRPKSFEDTENEETADKFVLTNIRLPQVYLRRAERELSQRLVSYMYDNNYQKFNFSIGFSRIFLAQNQDVDNYLNENSVVYVSFNNHTYRQYVQHYTYKMEHGTVLPEIHVDMNEELGVSRTFLEKQSANEQRVVETVVRRASRYVTNAESRIARTTIGRNEDAVVGGNLVSRDAVTSFGELQVARLNTSASLLNTQVDLEVNHYRRSDFEIDENGRNLRIGENRLTSAYVSNNVIRRDEWNESTGEYQEDVSYRLTPTTQSTFNSFVSNVNTFNNNVVDKIMSIRYTMEGRFNMIQDGNCTTLTRKVYDLKDRQGVAFWTNKEGGDVSTTGTCPAEFTISWTNFS